MMSTSQPASLIAERVAQSKKYRALLPRTIRRIAEDCISRYGPVRAERETKRILHQMWGAYYRARPDFTKLLAQFTGRLAAREQPETALLPLLHAQSGTRERIPLLPEFYRRIFSVTGAPRSLIDHACGLNPLTLPWMRLRAGTRYAAYDIDTSEIEFLRAATALLRLPVQTAFAAKDLFMDTFDYADIVFMLKLLPALEHEHKGASLPLMRKQRCGHLVVSFPTRTLSRTHKRMEQFYRGWFMKQIADEHWTHETIAFPGELVFVVKK